MPPTATLLLALALTACAGTTVNREQQGRMTQGVEPAETTERSEARVAPRIGPPSLRGFGLRRIDQPSGAEPPIARYQTSPVRLSGSKL